MSLDSLEALESLVSCYCLLSDKGYNVPPGGCIEQAPPELREALKKLTSDDTRNQRPTPYAFPSVDWDPDPIRYWENRAVRRSREEHFGWLKGQV